MSENTLHTEDIELSIVMPCLNEIDTIGICIQKAKQFLGDNNIYGEIVIADNGSSDGSDKVAKDMGARVIYVKEKGYGEALNNGIKAAYGKYILMGDSDDSYDFLNLAPFLEKLRQGYDLVMGNRFKGGIHQGAMPPLNKYIGNPILSGIGKLFFRSKISDFHCGLRAFRKDAFNMMNLQTTGMEFASEIVVKATIMNMKITEVPTILSPDGRSGKPHLKPFRDGWRHLRFLLLYSPRWLFLYPGIILFVLGMFFSLWIFFRIDAGLDIHTMLFSSAASIIGFQLVSFAVYSKIFALHERLIPTNPMIDSIINRFTLEKGLIIGFFVILLGISLAFYTLFVWQEGSFFEIGIRITMRYVILSFLFIVLGFQVIISSFFFNMLKINTK